MPDGWFMPIFTPDAERRRRAAAVGRPHRNRAKQKRRRSGR